MVVFSITVAKYMRTLMILHNFISLLWFNIYMENWLWFELSLQSIWLKWNLHRNEFHFELMWTLTKNLTYAKVKFYPEVQSQTGLNSLRVSCKRVLVGMCIVTVVEKTTINATAVLH